MCSVKQAQASVQLDSTNKSSHIDNGSIILRAQIVHLPQRGKFFENLFCASPIKLMFCGFGLCPVYKIGAKYLIWVPDVWKQHLELHTRWQSITFQRNWICSDIAVRTSLLFSTAVLHQHLAWLGETRSERVGCMFTDHVHEQRCFHRSTVTR